MLGESKGEKNLSMTRESIRNEDRHFRLTLLTPRGK